MTTRLLKSSENTNGLPIGFQEVEYLESTGTQYIDTGVTIDTATDEVELYYQLIDGIQYKWIFGEHDTNARFGLGSGDGTNRRNVAYAASTIQKANTYFMSSQHYYKASTVGVYIDGTKMADYSSFSSNSTIYLFNLNLNNVNYCSQSRIWGYKHKRDGVLIRDFIPALNPAGIPCMYDLVGKKAYYNLGTGEFSYGRKIIPVEYLESTGTQYIDTGYIPIPTSTYKSTFQLTNITTTSGNWFCVFGSVESNNSTFTELFLPRASGDGDVNQILAGSHNSSYLRTNYPWAVNTKYIFEMNPTSVLVNGFSQGSISVDSSITCSHSIYLFARHEYNDAVRYNVSAKIHSFTIYENNTLVRDYIPCIDENNIPYMFDKVTHTCHLNAGTGTFNYGKKLYSSKVRLYKDSGARFGEVLPKGFKRVEYIENTGTGSARNWISTGIVPDTTTRWEVRISFNNTSTGKLMGCGYTNPNRFNLGIESSRFRFAFNGWFDANPDIITPDTNIHTWVMDAPSKTFTIDGYSTTTTQTFGTSTFPIALFGRCNSGNGNTETSNAVVGKIYYSKIWQNDVLVSDMVPVLDNDGIPCMYDKVSGELFYNKGTGEFTYGDVIPNKVRLPQSTEIRFPKGYTEVEYLESDSTAYIDTGVSGANDNFKIEMGFSYSKFTAYGYFFSNYESEQHNTTRFLLDSSNNSRALAYINTKSQDGAIYNSNCTKDNFHTFVLTKTSVSIDGNTTTNNNPPVGTANTKNIILFNRGAGTYYEKRDIGMRCYYFRIYDNDNLIRYFIPALDPNGKPCMWDVVTKQPFYNQGTGEFTYGRTIQQVSYLESSGGQYIDTGIQPTDDYGYRIKNTYTVGQGEQCAIGCMDNGNRFVGIYTNGASNNVSGAWGDYVGFLPSYPWTTGTILDVKCNYKNSRKIIIDSTEMKDISDVYITGTINNSIYIGARHYGSNITKMQGKIYSTEITNGTEIIADYVPAIDSNNVGFMFDRVTHTIFDNKGTGSFSYGNVVPNKLRN